MQEEFDEEKVYTITKFVNGKMKKSKKRASEMSEEDVLYFYRTIAEAYNAAPDSAKLLFMHASVPSYVERMRLEQQGAFAWPTVLGGEKAEA